MHGGLTNEDGSCDVPDIMGINYNIRMYEKIREKYPDIPLLGSENTSAFQVRGEYKTDNDNHIIDSYDNECAMWGRTYRESFKDTDTRDNLLGYFIWTGFDYRGEPTPFKWPSIGTFFGIMDTCGFKKNAYYINKAFFTSDPIIHILPHWNWNIGENVRVMAHTNCSEAELFLNGKSMGRKKVHKYDMADWEIEFEPGTLSMIGYRDGQEVCCDKIKTAGKAVRLIAKPHRDFIYSGCYDAVAVNVYAVDCDGVPIPDADMLVEFETDGGKVIGVGNGNPNSHEADKASKRHLFNGCVQAIVQLSDGVDKLKVRATAKGLESEWITIKTISGHEKAYLESVDEVYINNWRTNIEIFDEKPEPDLVIADNDMNSWEIEENGYSSKFNGNAGYGLYRTSAKVPAEAKRILFKGIAGDEVEIYINNSLAWSGGARMRDGRIIEIDDIDTGDIELTIIIKNISLRKGAGIIKPVVFLKENIYRKN